MEPFRKYTPEVSQLIDGMLRMLITYEMELTAYSLVLEKAQENFVSHGIPWDMMSNVRKVLKSPALAAEAEAEYAPFYALLQRITPENLAAAQACMKRRMDHHNASIPPEE
jgi:hypothetical protein